MLTRHTSRAALPAVVLAVLGLLLAGLVSPAGAATSSGKLKGVVTLDGKPVPFAKVQVYRTIRDVVTGDEVMKPTRLKTDNTDSSGRYSFGGLTVKAGYDYILLVTDRTGKTVKTSRYIDPRKNKTITKNVHLEAATILRGTVNTVDGRSPEGLTVAVDVGSYNDLGQDYEVFYPEWKTSVKADGTFKLAGLPANSYDAVFVSDGPYATQCYDFTTGTLADCGTDQAASARQRIQLAKGEDRTLPTVTASKFAPAATKLTGKVTDTSGKALKGISVRVASADGAEATAVTRSSGRFAIDESLPAGSYVVRFDDRTYVWASQYLGGGPDKSVRQRIVITPGQPVTGLDTKLKSLASAKIATKAGTGSVKVAVRIKRKSSGSAPSGTFTVSLGDVSRTVVVTKGKATVTLTGLPRKKVSLTAVYSGTSTTAGFSRLVKVKVK